MRFVLTAAEEARRQATQSPPAIIQPAVPAATYESIKAKIDHGIKKLGEGRKEVAEAIKEMIETEAYTKKYKTIAAFAEHEYGKSKAWIYKMISECIPDEPEDNSEGHGSDQSTNTPNQPASATVTQPTATSNGTPPTQAAAEPAPAEPTPKPAMDISGCVIPKRLLLMLERRDEVKEACKWASSLKSLFEKIQNEPDPLYFHVKNAGSVQTFMTGAATMRHQLAECSPDVVCPECGGKSESCHYCNGSGWICQVRWNREWVKSNDRLKGAEVAKRAANL